MIEDWKPRLRPTRVPKAYMEYNEELHASMWAEFVEKGGDPNLPSSPELSDYSDFVFPDPAVIPTIELALDQLDAGIPLRKVMEWYNNQVPENQSLSHSGIRDIWDAKRPDHPKKARPSTTKKTLRDRIGRRKYNKMIDLANEKRSLAFDKKRIEKKEKALKRLLGGQTDEPENNIIELPAEEIEYDFEAIPEAEVVYFRPHPGPQTEFFAADELEVLYGGAAGGGKSYGLLADPMRYFDHPEFNGLILRRTNDELRELIWKSKELYKKIFPKAVWSEKKSSWTFPAGGHLWFTYCESDEDVLRYQGQAFNYIGFDELTQYPSPFIYNYLRSRLRTTAEDLPVYMRATTNPGGPGHWWVKKMFIDPSPAGVAFPATDIDTGEIMTYPEEYGPLAGQPLFYRKFIQARLSDNPSLAADGRYEISLLSLPEAQRRRLLEGDWDVADGAAFSEFRRSLHVCEPFEIPENWLRFRSCDYGYSERQASAVHWYAVDPTYGTLYVYRELYVNQHTGKQLARRILQIEGEAGERISYGVLDSSVWARRGQTGPSIAEEMLMEGCRMRPSDRAQGSRIASKNRLHELLKIDPYSEKPGIIFFNTCRQIIADLPVIPMSKEDDDIDRKYPNDHAYDSIRYGIQTRPKVASDWDYRYRTEQQEWRPASSKFGY